MPVKMLMLVFWVVTSCGLLGRYRRFGGTYYFMFRDSAEALKVETSPHGVTNQKTVYTVVYTLWHSLETSVPHISSLQSLY
jgi:hypothetical protein